MIKSIRTLEHGKLQANLSHQVLIFSFKSIDWKTDLQVKTIPVI